MTEALVGAACIGSFVAYLSGALYFVHRVDVNTVYEKKVVPLIEKACYPHSTENVLSAYRQGLEILEKSWCPFNSPSERKKYTKYLRSQIKDLEAGQEKFREQIKMLKAKEHISL